MNILRGKVIRVLKKNIDFCFKDGYGELIVVDRYSCRVTDKKRHNVIRLRALCVPVQLHSFLHSFNCFLYILL